MTPPIRFGNLLRKKGVAWASLLLLATLLAVAVFLRIYRLDAIGLRGSDEVYYTNIAESWHAGQPIYQIGIGPRVFRPVYYLYLAASFTLFGYHDGAIKLMNFFTSLASLFVFIAILYHTLPKRPVWFILACALVYAAMPVSILDAHREMTTTLASLLVLVSFLFFVRYSQSNPSRRRYLYLLLCGLFVGFAVMTHEELIFLLPGYALCIALCWKDVFTDKALRKPAARELLFFGAVGTLSVLPTLVSMWTFQDPYVEGVFFSAENTGLRQVASILGRIPRSYWNSILGNTSVLFTFLFLLIGALLLARAAWRWASKPRLTARSLRVKQRVLLLFSTTYLIGCALLFWSALLGNAAALFVFLVLLTPALIVARWSSRSAKDAGKAARAPLVYFFPLVITITHIILCGYFFEIYLIRLFVPLLPLILIFVGVWSHFFLDGWPERRAQLAVIGCSLMLIASMYGSLDGYPGRMGRGAPQKWFTPAVSSDWRLNAGIRRFKNASYATSWAKTVHNDLKSLVNDDARLLVTSSLMTPQSGRRQLQVGFYFGDNALYKLDHTEPLDTLIDRYRIRYVLLSRYSAAEGTFERLQEIYDFAEFTYARYLYQDRWEMTPLNLEASYGFAPDTYTIDREFDYLLDYLEARGAHLIQPVSLKNPTKEDIQRYLQSPTRYVVFAL